MAGKSVVRELITLWGFEIDAQPLAELDAGINTIKASLKGLLISAAGTAATVGFLLNEAGTEEQTRIAFETMLGSADAALKKLNALKQFALKTPFTVPGIQRSAKQLLGMGIESGRLINTLKILGDVSAGLSVPLARIALNFGQIKTQGRLTGRELRDFAVAGVPLLDELAKNMETTTAAITQMVSRGKIGFDDVEKAFISMTSGSGRFADLMDKQSRSFFGILSNLKDFILVLAIELGNELLPQAKAISSEVLNFLSINKKLIKQDLTVFVKSLAKFMGRLFGITKSIIKSMTTVAKVFGGWNKAINMTLNLLTALMTLGLLTGLGIITQAVFSLARGWLVMGNAALVAQAKMALIPLTIGAIVAAILLLAEDLIAFSEGRKSLFGKMLTAMDSAFGKMEGRIAAFRDFIKLSMASILTPLRLIIVGFKNMGIAIDILTGKENLFIGLFKAITNVKDAFNVGKAARTAKTIFGLEDKNAPEAPVSLVRSGVGALRKKAPSILQAVQGAQAATQQVEAANTPAIGLGAALFKSPINEQRTISVTAKNEITVNIEGADPETAKDLVTETIFGEINTMLREAVRDGESKVER